MRKFGFIIFFLFVAFRIYAIDGLLIKTIDYSFKEKWDNTIGSSIPKISSCDTVFKKQFFFIAVATWNFKTDANDSSEVLYSIKIIRPDNNTYFAQENLTGLSGKILNKDYIQMSDAIIKASFNDTDLIGKYKIEIDIVDKISGETKKIYSDITLAPLPPYEQFKVKDEDDFNNWLGKYYEKPAPQMALSYYIFYSQSSLANNTNAFWPVFSSFLEITKNNAYLLPQIIDCYKKQDLKTKFYLLYLLKYSNIGADNFLDNLTGDENNAYLKIKDVPINDIYGTITNPSQLDMLWGTFMASGSYKPIIKLIQTLDYSKYKGDLDKYKNSKPTEDDKQKAINNEIYNALVWSLCSNCNQYELVKEYCNWALQNEGLSEVQKDELEKILKTSK